MPTGCRHGQLLPSQRRASCPPATGTRVRHSRTYWDHFPYVGWEVAGWQNRGEQMDEKLKSSPILKIVPISYAPVVLRDRKRQKLTLPPYFAIFDKLAQFFCSLGKQLKCFEQRSIHSTPSNQRDSALTCIKRKTWASSHPDSARVVQWLEQAWGGNGFKSSFRYQTQLDTFGQDLRNPHKLHHRPHEAV